MNIFLPILTSIWQLLYNFSPPVRMVVIIVIGANLVGITIFRLFPFVLSLVATIVGYLWALLFIIILFPGWIYNFVKRTRGNEPSSFVNISEDFVRSILNFFEMLSNKIKKFNPKQAQYTKLKRTYNWIWISGGVVFIYLTFTNPVYMNHWISVERQLGANSAFSVSALISDKVLVATTDANLRQEPGLNKKQITIVSKDETVYYLNESQTDKENRIWYKVKKQNGQMGWISSSVVRFSN